MLGKLATTPISRSLHHHVSQRRGFRSGYSVARPSQGIQASLSSSNQAAPDVSLVFGEQRLPPRPIINVPLNGREQSFFEGVLRRPT